MLDPKWNNGDYYGRDEPLDGLAQALKIVTITDARIRLGREDVRLQVGGSGEGSGGAMGNVRDRGHAHKAGAARANRPTRNSMIYTAKANQLYNLGDDVKKIKAKILFVPAASDESFRRSCRSAPPSATGRRAVWRRSRSSKATAATSRRAHVAKQGEAIRAFLAEQRLEEARRNRWRLRRSILTRD